MKYFIGSDHAGFGLKTFVKEILESSNHQVIDLGADGNDRVDYPDFAKKVAQKVADDKTSKGILICGTGIGMSMSANKIKGIRAALCHNVYSAIMAREHNDANILCLGERVTGKGVVEEIVQIFDKTKFAGGRHSCRVEKINILDGEQNA